MLTRRELVNLRKGRDDWYRVIRNQAGGPTQVMLYDEIGLWGTTAADFIAEIGQISGPIELHLSTEGGEIFDGINIYEALKPRQPSVIVDSLAASIGSVIAMAAAPGLLTMNRSASMMIHEAHGAMGGRAADFRHTADLLDKKSDDIADIYAERTGRPASLWREAMRAETWYRAQEAVNAGLADRVAAPRPVNSLRNASADESPWDASRAWANGAASDSPASFYRGICAGEKTAGDPATQAHWALPHHYHPGDPPNAAGVRNAMSRLPQTQGLANAEAAHSHLQAHMHAISPDSHPDMGSVWDPDIFRRAFQEAK